MLATMRARSASGKPSSRMKPGGQIEGPGAGHGHIVDGAVDRQAADVAAGEEQRRDHMPVGAHHQAPGRRR